MKTGVIPAVALKHNPFSELAARWFRPPPWGKILSVSLARRAWVLPLARGPGSRLTGFPSEGFALSSTFLGTKRFQNDAGGL